MREVVDGVFELTFGFVNVHLVVTDDGVQVQARSPAAVAHGQGLAASTNWTRAG